MEPPCLALCPGCGQWHKCYYPGVQLCRFCWLGEDDEPIEQREYRFLSAVERFRVWYKGTYGEEALP